VKITVTETTMRATSTGHTASRDNGGWTVTWLPGQVLTREHAVTAMKIAAAARLARAADSPARALLREWAAELGLPGPRAARMAAAPVARAGTSPGERGTGSARRQAAAA
jgi:hypothetical protein